MGYGGGEDQKEVDDENESVELRSRIPPSDEGKECVEPRGRRDEKECE